MPIPASETYPPLISLAVHELRTPVGVVSGYLRMLMRDTDEPLTPRQRKLVDEADKSCLRMAAMIAELSDVGKIDAGIIALARQPLDLLPLLTEVVSQVHEASDRDVHLRLRADNHPVPIVGDTGRLRSAFDAVFRAVLREKPGPAEMVADCRRRSVDGADCYVVVVAEARHVDEALERPRRPFAETRGGMGLALPLARRVFEGHRGQIWAPQPPPGRSETDDPLSRSSAVVAIPVG